MYPVHNHTLENLSDASHTIDLEQADFVTLYIDHQTSGLGGSSFSYHYQEEFLLTKANYDFSFWMRPVKEDLPTLPTELGR